ncbi:MAG: hypothetical protein FGM24_06810 [Candidatus Kapabacteria bacterium]|nr:hypothetical protein [Candidatus Kapabacteria bacterium]
MLQLTRYHRPLAIITVLMVHGLTVVAGPRDHEVPISISYGVASNTLATTLDASGGFGISLGYRYLLNRNFAIGLTGVVERASITKPSGNVLSLYHMLATIRYRPLKHGWSPYVQVEGGLVLPDADATSDALRAAMADVGSSVLSYGARLGATFPVSARVDVDVHARLGLTATENPLTMLGLHAGIVLRQ